MSLEVSLAIISFVFAYLFINSQNKALKNFSFLMIFFHILLIFIVKYSEIEYSSTFVFAYGMILIFVFAVVLIDILREFFKMVIKSD